MIVKAIPGFDGYFATDTGTIIGKRGRPLAPSGDRYFNISLSFGDNVVTRNVHKLVCLAFHGEPPSVLHEAAHNDGNRYNNVPTNLRWATRLENMKDNALLGIFAGENNPNSVITAEQVAVIRSRYAFWKRIGRSRVPRNFRLALQREFNISDECLRRVVNHITWATR